MEPILRLLLNRVFEGDAAGLVASLFETRRPDAADLARLERLRVARPDDEGLSRFWGQPREPKEDPGGALVFWSERPGTWGHTDIYRAAPVGDGSFAESENIGPPINSELFETGAVVAPDGSYIVFGRDDLDGGYGLGDLYVSFREAGTWTEPRNLGPLVNSHRYDYGPSFTPDGRYLFFSGDRALGSEEVGRHNIYFVEIDALGLDRTEPGGSRP